jgi:hypothetical protein
LVAVHNNFLGLKFWFVFCGWLFYAFAFWLWQLPQAAALAVDSKSYLAATLRQRTTTATTKPAINTAMTTIAIVVISRKDELGALLSGVRVGIEV